MNDIAVVVQTVVGREASLGRTLASLEASDVKEWEVIRDEEGNRPKILQRVLATLAESGARLGLRLEDDATVNRHLAHNLCTWDAPSDEEFGAGWLFSPGGVPGIWSYIRGSDHWGNRARMHGAAGCVFRVPDIAAIAAGVARWNSEYGPAQDLALSAAIHAMGRKICFHNPCLVEHRLEPSTLGHVHGRMHTSLGAFRLDWRRR